MKKISLFFAVFVLCCGALPVLAEVGEISKIKGDVVYYPSGDQASAEPAAIGLKLDTGDRLESSPGSFAEILFNTGHKASIGANSSILIKEAGEKTTLELFKGNLKSKVKKLAGNQDYSVLTPQSVCAVRGTVFKVFSVGQDTKVLVYEGSVEAKEIETGSAIVIPAGKYTVIVKNENPAEPADISALGGEYSENEEGESADGDADQSEEPQSEEEESSEEEPPAEEEPAEEDTNSEAAELDDVKAELKSELKEAVNEIKVDVATARDVVEEQKQNDTASEKTLRDVHGNLIRVGQYLLRPTRDVVQIVNITKRDNYKYGGRFNVATSGSRIDSLDQKITFNMELPDKISDWPDFFKKVDDNDLDFHPMDVRIELSNQTDKIITTIEYNKDEDDFDDPVVKMISGKTNETWIVDMDEDIALDSGEGAAWPNDDADKLELWAVSPKIRLFMDADGDNKYDANETEKIVRIGGEGWVIDNDGKILDKSSVEDGNPFELIRNIASEMAMVCRYDLGDFILDDNSLYDNPNDPYEDRDLTLAEYDQIISQFNDGTDLFQKNFDIVITPDFIVKIIEENASLVTEIESLDGGDDESDASSLPKSILRIEK